MITIRLVTIHGRRIEEKARKSENKKKRKKKRGGKSGNKNGIVTTPVPGGGKETQHKHKRDENTAGKRRNNTCVFVASLCIVWSCLAVIIVITWPLVGFRTIHKFGHSLLVEHVVRDIECVLYERTN